MKQEIKSYYDQLAKDYDQDRFDNSYGEFIHHQETKILNKYLQKNTDALTLDLACGTGRFLEYASHGIDLSGEMLKVAKAKFPQLDLRVADGEELPFEDKTFDQIISFHLMMHLDQQVFKNILQEAHRVTKEKGYFIFDIPSKKRRAFTKYTAESWHGGNQLDIDDIKKTISTHWDLVNYHGVSFLPLHRIPTSFRKKIITFDNYMCSSILKEYASYLVIILQKK